MKLRIALTYAGWVAISAAGCSAASHREVLTRFFDGVPPPKTDEALAGQPAPEAATEGSAARVELKQHAPYEAKACDNCHAAAASNTLVEALPGLCYSCHESAENKPYVHAPVAAGECLLCHDPHGSRYEHLLVADLGGLCLGCHDREVVSKIDGHGDVPQDCTTCHDPHGSETNHLLK